MCYCSSQAIQVEATPSAPGGCIFPFRGRISSSGDTFGAVRTGVRRFFSSQCGRYPAVAIFCESRLAFRLQLYILYCCLSCIDYFEYRFGVLIIIKWTQQEVVIVWTHRDLSVSEPSKTMWQFLFILPEGQQAKKSQGSTFLIGWSNTVPHFLQWLFQAKGLFPYWRQRAAPLDQVRTYKKISLKYRDRFKAAALCNFVMTSRP